jgi:hypothetical protein
VAHIQKDIRCKECGVEIGVGIEEGDSRYRVFNEGELRSKCKVMRGQRIANPMCPHLNTEINALAASTLPGGKNNDAVSSDFVNLLESIPIWKSLSGLPKRLAELESRVKSLEMGGSSLDGPRPNECPSCGAVMTLKAESLHPVFRDMGVKVHTLHCDGCRKEVSRHWSPINGYG